MLLLPLLQYPLTVTITQRRGRVQKPHGSTVLYWLIGGVGPNPIDDVGNHDSFSYFAQDMPPAAALCDAWDQAQQRVFVLSHSFRLLLLLKLLWWNTPQGYYTSGRPTLQLLGYAGYAQVCMVVHADEFASCTVVFEVPDSAR
jgi:hypothetical protein